MNSVIVLNMNWQFWEEVSDRKAMHLLRRNKIDVIVPSDRKINTQKMTIIIPAVVRLSKFVGFKVKKAYIPYKDRVVYHRDENICQYWHFDEKGRRASQKSEYGQKWKNDTSGWLKPV